MLCDSRMLVECSLLLLDTLCLKLAVVHAAAGLIIFSKCHVHAILKIAVVISLVQEMDRRLGMGSSNSDDLFGLQNACYLNEGRECGICR
jgi:hypothetical protein